MTVSELVGFFIMTVSELVGRQKMHTILYGNNIGRNIIVYIYI